MSAVSAISAARPLYQCAAVKREALFPLVCLSLDTTLHDHLLKMMMWGQRGWHGTAFHRR
jgi:hypothetical protein